MVVIYLDVLIGLNLYISWMLLCCTERLCGAGLSLPGKAIGTLLGGASSLLILLPPLPFLLLLAVRLGLALLIVRCSFGRQPRGALFKRTMIFFGVSFLFAGCMLAIWAVFAPPKLLTRNGCLYYHLSPLTLIVSTILAYAAVKLLAFFLDRRPAVRREIRVTAGLDGREVPLRLQLDTGNTARSTSGLPAVFCTADRLKALLPPETADCFSSLEQLTRLSGHHLAGRVQMTAYRVLGGRQLTAGIVPDYLRSDGGKTVRCLLVPVGEEFGDGSADGIAGETIFSGLLS